MVLLGIDYGQKKCGVSITDELLITVQGYETIQYNKDKDLLNRLDQIILEKKPDIIVVGLPLNMKGEKTLQTENTEKFIHKLKCKYNKIKIDQIDERLTSVQAQKTMKELNMSFKKNKTVEDTLAATYILETYIEKNKKTLVEN